MSSGEKIKEGDEAPDFALASQTGQEVRLSDVLKQKSVVLYFYPKDETPGCTAEACSFRDQYEVFTDAGAEVIGISSDSVESHKSFAQRHNLPYILLSDEKGEVRKLYGVPSTFGLIPGRVTYVIDRKGVVRYAFSSQFRATQHVAKALEILRGMGEAE